MAVVFKETWESRKGGIGANDASIVLCYFATGTTDENELYLAIIAGAPTVYDGLIRSGISWSNLGGPNWSVELTYGTKGAGGGDQPVGDTGSSGMGGTPTPEPTAPFDDEPMGAGYTFEITGATTHKTQSFGVANSATIAGVDDLDVKNAIGLSEDGVAGCDVFSPQINKTRTVSRRTWTPAYEKKLADMFAHVNNEVFYGYRIGEVLYLGANAQQTQGGLWSVTHHFSIIRNSATLEISDELILDASPANHGFAKLGWQYLDVHYEKRVAANQIAPRPIRAYVHDVYEFGTFSRLEIGE